MRERSRVGIDGWLEDRVAPSVVGMCLDFGVDPAVLSDLVVSPDGEWLAYGVYRIMAILEERLYGSVTGLRDMLVRCERLVGGGKDIAPEDSEAIDRWIAG